MHTYIFDFNRPTFIQLTFKSKKLLIFLSFSTDNEIYISYGSYEDITEYLSDTSLNKYNALQQLARILAQYNVTTTVNIMSI